MNYVNEISYDPQYKAIHIFFPMIKPEIFDKKEYVIQFWEL
jgi:hypothetical protein